MRNGHYQVASGCHRNNIIFDFGNVLVEWHPEHIFGEYFAGKYGGTKNENEAKAWWFLRHVADNDWRLRIDAGESQEKCIKELQQKYPDYTEAIELYRSKWREMLTNEVAGMRELLTDLEQLGYGIFGLTNWSMETFPEARKLFTILQMIDRYVVSGAEGYVKPDARLFQILLDRYGLKSEECIFVDDNPDNVAAASGMGMQGILFTGADVLRKQLIP